MRPTETALRVQLVGIALGFVFLSTPLLGADSASPTPSESPNASETPARHVELRLHGSNTIGKELAPALVMEWLKSLGATSIQRRPGAKEDETDIEAVLPDNPNQKVTFEIQAHGSATSFQDLLTGKCDIGMASRKINDDEVKKCAAAGLGDMLSSACENVLGLDGIAVIVNHSNPVQSLSKQQIGDLFTGKITDWSQVGGSPGQINLYRRDDKSGTFDTFKSLVLGGNPISDNAVKFEDSEKLSDKVASDPNGIGFIGLPFVRSARALSVSDGKADALYPNEFTVSTEDYPIARRLFLYIPANPQNKWTRKFIEFALSSSGQSVVGANGFISQTVTATKPNLPTSAPRAFLRQAANASRLSVDFRFTSGSSQLDNKAVRDLDRLYQFLAQPENSGVELMLFGFADNTGTRSGNLRLSIDRANVVAKNLKPRGITPGLITGYGQDLPVSSNDTDDGRKKNRRVEVWIR